MGGRRGGGGASVNVCLLCACMTGDVADTPLVPELNTRSPLLEYLILLMLFCLDRRMPCTAVQLSEDVITAGPFLCPHFGFAPWAQAAREHRWRHIEHLLFDCQCIPGLHTSVALTLLRDDLFRVCSSSDHAEAVLLAVLPTSRIPVDAAMACIVPFLLDPAAALGRMSPWHIKSQCLDLVAVFLLGASSAVCTRQPPTASMLARFHLPAWSSVHAWLLRLQTGSDFAPACLPTPDPVMHVSASVRMAHARGAVADARLGLA